MISPKPDDAEYKIQPRVSSLTSAVLDPLLGRASVYFLEAGVVRPALVLKPFAVIGIR